MGTGELDTAAKLERLDLLSQALAHLLSTDDPDRIVRELFPKVATHLRIDTYFNYMVNAEGDAMYLHSYAGISAETAHEIRRLEFGQAICGRVAVQRSPIVATDIQNSDYEPAALVRSFGIQAYACNPLMSGSRLLGTLSFASKSRPSFDESELEFIRTITNYVALAMDRVAERELLERRVDERTEGLLKANERLQGFTYSVAHDLRQQIRAISAHATIVLDDAGPQLDESNQNGLRKMARAAVKLGELTDDLLRYAKLDRIEPRLVSFDLSDLATEIVQDLKEGGTFNPRTKFVIQEGMESSGDLHMIRIVLENLIHNGCKYSQHADPPVVEIGQDEEGYFVRDNGVGFDMAHSHKLFSPFERLHKDSFEGTGIGLASVKRIVERHGGRVSANGASGKGATFRFTLHATAD